MGYETLQYLIPICGLAALLFAWRRSAWIRKQDAGDEAMIRIAGHIRDGAMAFLGREYRVLAIFVVVVSALLAWANSGNPESSALVGVSMLAGAVCSGLAGFFGMRVATAANVRTASAARTGIAEALRIAFSGGAVMGFSVVGLGVLGLSLLFLGYSSLFETGSAQSDLQRVVTVLTGFSLGASSIALFARVGGGIYTKAADIGADLVGKLEAGIPEDDPRNPAVIADNVGDNVGDVAGMGADLFESYVGSVIGSLVLGVGATRATGESFTPTILRLADAVRGNGLEFLLEIISSKVGPVADDTTARVINRIYAIGVRPDWWKLEPMTTEAAWAGACAAIEQNDPWCRGVVVLGLDTPEAALADSFAAAARHQLVKGFAVGRTIFTGAARAWFGGELDDAAAVATMAARFRRLCGLWDQARDKARAGEENAP